MLSKESIRKFEETHGRSLQLRRQFNRQQLLQGGQKRKAETDLEQRNHRRRNPLMSSEDGAKKVINIPAFLGAMDCQDVIQLDNIDWDHVPELKLDEREYDEEYALSKMRKFNPKVCKGDAKCLAYYAKCLFLHLKKKYGKPSIKECWYEAIRRGNVDDYERFTMVTKETTTIGQKAFNGDALTEVTIPSSVITIEREAFCGYDPDSNEITGQLTSITFQSPFSLLHIGRGAFSNNKLTEVTIPSSVTAIGGGAFQFNNLTSVIIPSSVITIGEEAFRNNRLTSVIIPDSVTTIGDSAFQENRLTEITIPPSVTTIGEGAFFLNKMISVTIPPSVTTIGEEAFSHNQLTSVTFESPPSVTTIGQSAFYLNQLTSVTIPSSVTTIGKAAFGNNLKLTNVTFESPSSITAIGEHAFDHYDVDVILEQ